MKLKFRSKFNHGYLQSVVWKDLYDFNLIDDGPFFRSCSGIGGTKKAPLPKIGLTYPTMMTLGTVMHYLKKIQKIYKSRDIPLEFCRQHFFRENQQILLYQEIQKYIAFEHIISNSFNFFWVFKSFFLIMAGILIMSAKLPTVGLLKIKTFSYKNCDIIISVHDVTKRILSRDSNHL